MFLEIMAFIFCVLLYLFWRDNFSEGAQPPGPIKLPIIGNIHQIAVTGRELPHEAFDILSKKYGPIMSLKMGMKEAIILSSFEDMTEILHKDECSDRILEEFIAERNFSKEQGLIFGNGEGGKVVRNFTIRSLRAFGFGKKLTMEAAILNEVQDLVEDMNQRLAKTNGKFNVELFFNLNLLNVLWTMVAGKRFTRDDPKLKRLMDLQERAFKAGNFGSDISIAFPFFRHILPGLTGAKLLSKLFKELQEFFREFYNEVRVRRNPFDSPKSFADAFMKQIDEEYKLNQAQRYFTEEQFITVMIDLFQTGAETLNRTLSYAILFMILNPEVQKKVQDEIDAVVPCGNIQLSHKAKMVYTEATLLEVLRMGDVTPLLPPRKVTNDFTYKGYEFKKGMSVISNLYSVMFSDTIWGDAEVFRPGRFIGPNGQLCNTEKLAPFGFGKRSCMGENMATSSMFLFFGSMLKNFTFKTIPNEPDPTTRAAPGFTLTPKPFNMIVEIREKIH